MHWCIGIKSNIKDSIPFQNNLIILIVNIVKALQQYTIYSDMKLFLISYSIILFFIKWMEPGNRWWKAQQTFVIMYM